MSGDTMGTTWRWGALAALMLLSVFDSAKGQDGLGGNRTDPLEDYRRRLAKDPATVSQPPGVALESVVKPEEYHVGPSDVFSVNIWVSPPLSYALTVSPEGSLIIPNVGEVAVADISLAEAKEKVVFEVRRKYRAGEVTMTLTSPRPIVVMVTGSVRYPGLYTLSAMDRAHRAIEQATKPVSPEPRTGFKEALEEMSTRNVVLTHKDGTRSRVDIDKFFATRDGRWNPFLREGDVVQVPRKDQARNFVAIYGEVNAPGRFEYVPGDHVKDLFLIAQGFTRYARADSVLHSRLDSLATRLQTQVLDLRAILDGRAEDVPLEPGDRVVVLSVPEYRQDYNVTVLGEVRYPGTYPITRNTTRLTELIDRAGGFTEVASLSASYITRRVPSRGVLVDSVSNLRGRAGGEDWNYYSTESALLGMRRYVQVNFAHLFTDGDSLQNVVLQPYDTVHVSRWTNTVYVFGQVVQPGYVPFVGGKDVEYYILEAGGELEAARLDDIKVIKATNKQWIPFEDTVVEEGDYIWVPKDPEREFGYYLGIIGQTASILSVAISVVVIVTTLGN
ncbi:MAG: SLBB domain-containing protein [Bacteroidota bacterium]